MACVLILSLMFPCFAPVCAAPAPVYLVIGSDSAIWNDGTTVDVTQRHPHYPQELYADAKSVSYQVMEPAFRAAFKDSFGQALKLTWWMHGGNIYRDADNLNVPVASIMTLYLMKKYHGAAIASLGDELSLHYHTYFWSDYNRDGKFYWNQANTFHESRDDFDVTVAQYLLEESVFPVSFRSGWHFMDNEWQQELDTLLPFNLHNASPRKTADTTEPIGNVLDWSQATTNFVPFHPSPTNYQLSGSSKSWTVRSIKMLSLVPSDLNQLFAGAAGGTSQVACLWGHLPESFLTAITNMAAFVRVASSNYPAVPFRYCTAIEAMQRWQNNSDQTPPELTVTQITSNQTVTLSIQTSEPIFQPQPFVALRDAFQQYSNVTSLCVPAGSNAWSIVLPVPRNRLAKVGVAVTDESGNTTNCLLRFLPDDLYLDNLDPAYAEVQGAWTSTTNAAWGTNARIALLSATNVARARWELPMTRSGIYSLSVQVPTLTNAATNAVFNVISGGSNILSVRFPGGLATNQWVFLGAPLLDASLSNSVDMTVSNASGRYAAADVLRVTPVPDTNAPVLAGVSNLIVNCAGPAGTPVAFSVRATDAGDPHPAVWTSVASGSLFPVGLATVSCAATDASGNVSTGSFTVFVRETQPPLISQQPPSRTNLFGSTASFTVAAASCGPLRGRWLHNGSALPGATNTSLVISNLQLADAGSYALILSNSVGAVTSAVAVLTVNRPPVPFPRGLATTMNQPVRVTAADLIGPGYDPDGDTLTVTVRGASSAGGTIGAFGGSFAYSPATNFTGLDSFTYTLDDGRGGAASAPVQVLVVAGPLPASNQLAMVRVPNGWRIRFAAPPGTACAIQRSTDLVSWITLATIPAPVHGIIEFEDTNAPLATAFYRAARP